jgi:hypothetical protein
MIKRWGAWGLVIIACLAITAPTASAADSETLIKLLIKKGLITEQELESVAAELAGQETKPPAKEAALPVMMDKVGSSLKIKGRWAAGYFQGGEDGTDPNGAFRAPEAKVQLAFAPDAVNTVITRFNLNNASPNNNPLLDYFYLESKDFLPVLKDYPINLATRLGRFKMDFGEETWSNNSVEGALPSNSVANVAGNDEGAQIALTGKTAWSPRVVFGVFNGNTTTLTDNAAGKAFTAKLSVTPLEELYLSTSFFDSRALKGQAGEMSVAGLTGIPTLSPTSAVKWSRHMWEVDARYDIGKGKAKLDPPAYTDSVAYLKSAYGLFTDDAKGGTDRRGDYAFLEGLWNILPKWYTAARWSIVDFDQEASATINSITTVKTQQRYALGGGYRWSKHTLVKGEWAIDHESGRVVADDASNNLLSLLVASQF